MQKVGIVGVGQTKYKAREEVLGQGDVARAAIER